MTSSPTPPFPTLAGRVAIVTGAGAGIGRQIAMRLAAAGSAVAVCDVDAGTAQATAAAIEASGGKARSWQLDVADAAAVANLFPEAIDHFGRLDVLVANAGVTRAVPFIDMDQAEFDRVLNVNLRGVFLCGQAAARHFIAAGQPGHIVNITSSLGIRGSLVASHYAASKGAVNALTRSMAAELASHRIDVMAAGPGQTDTAMWQSMYPNAEREQRRAAGFVNDASDFADLIVFLAGSSGLSGQVIARGDYIPS